MLGGGLEFRYSVVGEGEMGNGEFVLKCVYVCVGGEGGGRETFNLRGHHVVNRSS